MREHYEKFRTWFWLHMGVTVFGGLWNLVCSIPPVKDMRLDAFLYCLDSKLLRLAQNCVAKSSRIKLAGKPLRMWDGVIGKSPWDK